MKKKTFVLVLATSILLATPAFAYWSVRLNARVEMPVQYDVVIVVEQAQPTSSPLPINRIDEAQDEVIELSDSNEQEEIEENTTDRTVQTEQEVTDAGSEQASE